MGSEVYTLARAYRDDLGFSVIPVKDNKVPAVQWLEYQTRKATDKELEDWFLRGSYNVGIVTGEISGICVVDIDTADGESNLKALCPQVFDAPTVFTPRGGCHLYHAYRKGIRNKAGAIVGTDLRGDGGYVVAPPSVGPNGKTYSWKEPPETLGEWPILPEAYVVAVESIQTSRPSVAEPASGMFTEGRRDNDLFHLAHTLLKGGMPQEEIMSCVTIAAKACKPPLDSAVAAEKVRSAIERASRAERNITEEIRNYVNGTSGYFLVSELQKDLGLFSIQQRKAASVALTRLVSEKVIEHYGAKSGVYRKYDTSLESMDWMNAETEPFDCTLPLDLSDYVSVYPNNIIVVAGAPDSGKTAFMLDFVKRNMHRHDIHYFNSEMGESELRMRLTAHDDIMLSDWRFNAYSRCSNFADVIKPASVNIIDFLEITDAFYKVAAEINDIYRKLDGGIAIIGLQKNRGTDLGRGGTFSLEKPRLYLAMDYGKVRIVKAKNRKNRFVNPNGWERTYHIFGGAKFEPTSDWGDPGLVDAGTGKKTKLF